MMTGGRWVGALLLVAVVATAAAAAPEGGSLVLPRLAGGAALAADDALAPDPAAERGQGGSPSALTPAADDAASAENTYLSYQEPGPPEAPGMLSLAGRVVGSLALVVGLIVVTALCLKRYFGGSRLPTTSRKVSQLIEMTPLGGRRYLYLIRVADRLLVVGAGGDRMTLLSEIQDPQVLEQVAALPRRSDFLELFHRVRAGRGKPAEPEATAAEPAVAG